MSSTRFPKTPRARSTSWCWRGPSLMTRLYLWDPDLQRGGPPLHPFLGSLDHVDLLWSKRGRGLGEVRWFALAATMPIVPGSACPHRSTPSAHDCMGTRRRATPFEKSMLDE